VYSGQEKQGKSEKFKGKRPGISGKSRRRETLFEKTKPIRRPLAGNPKHETRNPKRVERVLFEKTKPICRPSAGNPKHEARNPKQRRLTEPNLKKQSQFSGG
jgi:hypothetical protein